MVHGLLPFPERFEYLLDTAQAVRMFPHLPQALCFVGHTHVPQIFINEKDIVIALNATTLTLEETKKYIVNVGSVGQPRDGNPKAAYCIFDSEKKSLEIRRVPYPVEEAQARILAAGLPAYLARRLAVGL